MQVSYLAPRGVSAPSTFLERTGLTSPNELLFISSDQIFLCISLNYSIFLCIYSGFILLVFPWIFGAKSSSVQLLSCVQLFATPWIPARQASLSITNSQSSLRLMSIQSVMPSSHFILCRPLLLLPSIPPSIRVVSNESTLRMRWPKY